MEYSDLEKLFFIESPYGGFPADLTPEKVSGWHSDHPVFRELLEEIRPQLYIEVGTWLGASAIHVAEQLQEMGLGTPVLCIDTWLGAREFWDDIEKNQRYHDLAVNFGYPRIYYQFLANVIHRNQQGRILPLPQTSIIAGRILKDKQVKADMVYIDASHDAGDVYLDLVAYWELLNPGGIIFGDDFDEYWPGVVGDVKDFSRDVGQSIEEREGFWIIRKTATPEILAGDSSSIPGNRIVRLEHERKTIAEELDVMTRRAGHFYEQMVALEKFIEDSSNDGGDTARTLTELKKERDRLEKTARFFYEKKSGLELHNVQLEQRVKELQLINMNLSASEEKLRQELIALRKSIAHGKQSS